MAHIATKRFSYWGQLGILMALMGIGLLIGQGIGLVMLISKFPELATSPKDVMNKILVPENANLLRLTQLIAVIFMFILPAILYGRICHRKPMLHLGATKPIYLAQLVIAVLLILSALPLVGAFRDLTMHLPLGDYIKGKINESKDEYMKTIMAIAVMKDFGEYLLMLFIMAVLPGFAEEIIFRGAIQNLFTRWFKNPVVAILLSAFIFSAFHFEYSDFIGRLFLGVVLGWVFYITGNLWMSVIMHAAFNAFSVTALYITSQSKGQIDVKDVEDNFSLALTAIALAVLIALGYYLYKLNKAKNTDVPGQEVMLPGYINPKDPFTEEVNTIGNQNQV